MNMHHRARRSALLFLSCLALFASVPARPAHAQASGQNSAERKLLTRVEPEYPDALRKNFIGGVVRVEVVVSATGTVDKTNLLGGNPILGQAAMKAIKQWKYAPAADKEKLVVKVDFNPRND